VEIDLANPHAARLGRAPHERRGPVIRLDEEVALAVAIPKQRLRDPWADVVARVNRRDELEQRGIRFVSEYPLVAQHSRTVRREEADPGADLHHDVARL